MSPTEEILDYLDPAEIDARITNYRETIDLQANSYRSVEELQKIFDYIRLLIYVREFEDAASILHQSRTHIENALAEESNNDALLNLWIDWNELAMRFVLPEPDSFAELAFYKEIENICLKHNEKFRLRLLHNKLALLTHLENWKTMGGDLKILPAEQQEEVNQLTASAVDEVKEQLKAWKSTGAYSEFISLKRALLRYYNFTNQPKLSIEILKQLLDELPLHPDFIPTDLADVNLEIGSIYFNYSKYKSALPYLETARDLYEEAGPEFEVHASQADALIQECLEHEAYL